MNKYKSPELIEYGRIDQLTLGGAGTKKDFDLVNGKLVINADPNCSTDANFGCISIYVS